MLASPFARAMRLALGASLGAAGIGAAADVPIWLVNPGVAIPHDVPLRFGVPLPQGAFTNAGPVTMRLPGQAPLPVQTTAIEHWPDGSPRWLAVDVVVPSVPSGRVEARITPGEAPRAAGLRANTDTLSLRGTHLTATADADGTVRIRVLGSDAEDVALEPLRLDTGTPAEDRTRSVRLANVGPVRAELVVDRTHGDGVESRTTVVLWAESASILVRHRIVNLGTAPAAALRSASAIVRVPDIDTVTTSIDGTVTQLTPRSPATRLVQPNATTLTTDGHPAGTHFDGGLAVHSRGIDTTIVVPDFWQQFPKAIELTSRAIRIDLVHASSDPVPLGIGAAKSHDLWLRLERGPQATPLSSLLAAFGTPPRALAAPAWTRSTLALPGIIDADRPAAAAFLDHLRSDTLRYDSRARYERWDAGPPGPCTSRATENPQTGFYGVLNWGDWNFPGYRDDAKQCDAWGNLEYDLPFVFGLAWASTGDPTWATRFDRALTHYRDVDLIHAAPGHPEWVGLNHPHKVGHFDWRSKGTVDLGHVWLEGLLLHARLTGDRGSADAALALARRVASMRGKAGNARQYGWPMVALAAAATATGDRQLRDAALAYAHAAVARFPPDPAGGDWKLGILASGLAAVHRATDDAEVRTWLVAYGGRLLANPAAFADPRYAAIVGYLGRLTGDARYVALADSLAREMPLGTWGKTLAMHGRVGFELQAFLP